MQRVLAILLIVSGVSVATEAREDDAPPSDQGQMLRSIPLGVTSMNLSPAPISDLVSGKMARPEPLELTFSASDPFWGAFADGRQGVRTQFVVLGSRQCAPKQKGSDDSVSAGADESFGPCQCHKVDPSPGCFYSHMAVASGADPSYCSQLQQNCIADVQSLNVEHCDDPSSPFCDHGTVCQATYGASQCGTLSCNGQPCGITVWCWSHWGCYYCDN